ncbi:MAG: cyclic-phosphate processing receiver domain-containing protein [Candidatus Kariarchaeaceae archaeon]|jgi:hypothetical protein
MAEFHLLIDDIREYEMDHIARTPRDGQKALLSFPVTHLYLDHDLGDPDLPTGYDVLVWALMRDCAPPNIQLVTSNPVGRDRMAAALENAGYTKKNSFYIK